MSYPFARTRVKPKRGPRRTGDRVILHGEAKIERRREIFERSGGRCEAIVIKRWSDEKWDYELEAPCGKPITWETMQMSHLRHGAHRDDRKVIASCAECHQVGVHNPKACPRKPGRRMNKKEAPTYWEGIVCFCGWTKAPKSSLCRVCMDKIPPQLQHDLENAVGGDWLTAMALAEQFLLAWKPAEEQVK